MHRSGTSLMARLLNLSGLYLGGPEDMLPAGPTNPDGHWEHEGIVVVNEQLLAEFGGGWDFPPDLTALGDERRTARFAAMGRAHLAGFAGHDPWGWKDPRNSLTLPFWRRLTGPVHVVVCVRNPLEVALSLRMRNGSTIAFGLALWATYTGALLRATTRDERIVTHYQRYLADPVGEVDRIAARIGLAPAVAQRDEVRRFVRHDRRHSQFTAGDLRDVNVSGAVARPYHQLCVEAGAADEVTIDGALWPPSRAVAAEATDVPGRFDYDAMERLRRRSD
jgi:hypothetical protein